MRWEELLIVEADRSNVLNLTRDEVDRHENERVENRLHKPSKSMFMLGSSKKWARSLSGKWRTSSDQASNPMFNSNHKTKSEEEEVYKLIPQSDASRSSRQSSNSSVDVTNDGSSDNGYEPDSDSSHDNNSGSSSNSDDGDSSASDESSSQTSGREGYESDSDSLTQNAAADLEDTASQQSRTSVSDGNGYEADSDSSHATTVTAARSVPDSKSRSSIRWHWHWSGGRYTKVALNNVARRLSRTARHMRSISSSSSSNVGATV